ncbi:hypothetical protein ACMD2_12671 [Ananas comosus]|uniref:Senescence regulator n=1 Tax=Ananas comosus TaxID=4615 RepID=A0A199UR33_ANACO|nr:hypothetical protein ACMD2_12671 [Ananas comosus]
MAQENNHSATRRPHRFLTARPDSAGPTEPDSAEFDEFDVWGGGSGAVGSPPSDPVRAPRRPLERVAYPGSLPVSIPRWAAAAAAAREGTDGGDEAGRGWVVGGAGESPVTGGGFVPPHELLRRRCRAASFSVQEGLGRTLKGRDLSRVRNAVWAKIGFED